MAAEMWLFGLWIALALGCGLGEGTVAPVSCWMGCGPEDGVAYSESREGVCFFVNREAVDVASFCEALEFYALTGCAVSGSCYEKEWRRIREEHCFRDLSDSGPASSRAGSNSIAVDFHRSTGRKFLLHLSANSSVSIKLNEGAKQREEEDHITVKSASGKMAVVLPTTFLLCCALLCPCFHAKRKEVQLQAVSSGDLKVDSVASPLDVSTASERIPGTPLRVPGSPLRVPGSPLRVPPSPHRVPPSPSRFSFSPQLSRVGSVHLSMNQINKATQNFSTSNMIGEGGFGTVYKAQLADGQFVAIKRARKELFATLRAEFSNEIDLLSKIEHRNLVRLLGYVERGNERIIITEYVPNGTLREHLDGDHGSILDFNQRLEIAIDVAHALTYLHSYAEKLIIHRDVKSSNILLTDRLRAKVADFGFARIGPMNEDQTHISTKVKGTAGYLDPEYLKTYQLTPKSDVFSFGILLLEILSGRRPVDLKRAGDERITVRWAFNLYNNGKLMEVMDPELQEAVDEEIVSKLLALAFQCAAPTRDDRPTMKEVGEKLWEIRKEYSRNHKRENRISSSRESRMSSKD